MTEVPNKVWLDRVFQRTRNWGRWGAEDERGALNLITPERRAAAAALVREGFAVSCARDLPVDPSPENPRPAQHHMLVAGDAADSLGIPGIGATMDYVGVACHGMATSHIDAFCHIAVDGRLFNGFLVSDVKSTGAQRGSIMAAADGIVGRGVLLDVARLRGVEWLEPREAILPGELERAETAQGVRVGLAGLDPRCIPWIHERGIAVLGGDGVSDPLPASKIPSWPLPLHQCCLVGMGVHLLDNLALAELGAACASRNRWAFLFAVAPLRIQGGTGSPINPIALF